jgi:lysophospholipase L1-like esterase
MMIKKEAAIGGDRVDDVLTDQSTEEEEEGEEIVLHDCDVAASAVLPCESFEDEPIPSPPKLPDARRRRKRLLAAPSRRLWLLGGAFLIVLVAVLALVLFLLLAVPDDSGNDNGNPSREGGVGAPAPKDPIVQPIPVTPSVANPVCAENNWTITDDDNSLNEFLSRFRTGDYTPQCYNGSSIINNGDCRCPNPVVGSMPEESNAWNKRWQESNLVNRQRVQQAVEQGRKLDVILLGDSITEHWHGTDLGSRNPMFEGNVQVYRELFDSDNSTLQGLALGNGGDRTTQLLYRVETEGEIDPLEASVIWILIGTNDVLGFMCGVDEVVAGILSVARLVQKRKPYSTVVLQGLLPVLGYTGGRLLVPKVYGEINQRLACYADQNPRTRFVNMTEAFLTANGTINTELLVDGLHPGVKGSRVMGRRIVRVVRDILSDNNNAGNRGLCSRRNCG